eukprot:snap_masked-scaffold_41-processed-gene-2.54-mRNA-1 protein AED:1.00 eAED:1.00 QI:0/0/0/0/1/1/2/0/330
MNLEACHFPFSRSENSTQCDTSFYEANPVTSQRIKLFVFFPGLLVLLTSAFTLYRYCMRNLKKISMRIIFYSSSRFSKEETLLRANFFNGLFLSKGFESTQGKVQGLTMFSGGSLIALSQINFFPILKKLLGITKFSAKDQKLLQISAAIGAPYTLFQIPLMSFLLTLEHFDIYTFVSVYIGLFLLNVPSLAYPPYAISNVLIQRLGELQKKSGKRNTAQNVSSLKAKIKFFKQNAMSSVGFGIIAGSVSLVRGWRENPIVFLVLIIFLCTAYQIYIPTLVVYSKYVLPGRRLRGVGKRDTTNAFSRMSGSRTSTLEGSRVVPQVSRTKV